MEDDPRLHAHMWYEDTGSAAVRECSRRRGCSISSLEERGKHPSFNCLLVSGHYFLSITSITGAGVGEGEGGAMSVCLPAFLSDDVEAVEHTGGVHSEYIWHPWWC